MYLRYLLNGEVIQDDNTDTFSGISIVKLGKRSLALNIDSISDNHRGNYTCEASNAAGVARFSALLNVNGTQIIVVHISRGFFLLFLVTR